MTTVKTKIVIIEDNVDIRKGFKMLLNSTSNYQVVGEFDNCERALEEIVHLHPQVVLMDIDLPGMDGIVGTSLIKNLLPKTEILIITIFDNSERVFKALCAGATGYLTKSTTHAELVDALDEIIKGGAPMSAKIARMVINSFKRNQQHDLTEREFQVLVALVEGKTQKSIADELFISISTVKFHIKNIYEKLQVSTREEAILKARTNKII